MARPLPSRLTPHPDSHPHTPTHPLTNLAGHKRWALFPPGTPKHLLKPPGVEREAASWFASVYPATQRPDWPAARPIDVIQVCVSVAGGR